MGILNVTPDSFFDGGQFEHLDQAVHRGRQMKEEGADILDIGGESTRPGSHPVSVEEELRRVIPVVSELSQLGVPLSIDTSKPEVARQAMESGATIINDVTGLRNPEMIQVAAESGATVCIMHMLGVPRTMQSNPLYGDVVRDVCEYLRHASERAMEGGVSSERIWVDPGIGFGKTVAQNVELIRRLSEIAQLGFPILIGVSRKSFLGKILGSEENPAPVDQRLEASLLMQSLAQMNGAKIIRTHDVIETVRSARAMAAYGS